MYVIDTLNMVHCAAIAEGDETAKQTQKKKGASLQKEFPQTALFVGIGQGKVGK